MMFSSQDEEERLEKHFHFWSLLALGVGGTVGSGILVLSGRIAHDLAGPATFLSWLISGVVCALTALSYAELSTLIKDTGSTYAFSYHGLGEVFAVVGAGLLSLEYAISASAVARAWGDKVGYWMSMHEVFGCRLSSCWVNEIVLNLPPLVSNTSIQISINLMAGVILIIVTVINLCGLKLGRQVIDILVVFKLFFMGAMLCLGLTYFDVNNLQPFFLPSGSTENEPVGGLKGVLLGSTAGFFGYVGFDSVCCLSGETKRPEKTIPKAVIAVVSCVTIIYMVASLTLSGMVPNEVISSDEGFGSAFKYVGNNWAADLILLGEIMLILPVVVLVAFLPQSRILYVLSRDGMLPKKFSELDASGNLFFSSLASGLLATTVAVLVTFDSLNELISGEILLSFVFSTASLLMIKSTYSQDHLSRRYTSLTSTQRTKGDDPFVSRVLCFFVVASFCSSLLSTKGELHLIALFSNAVLLAVLVYATRRLIHFEFWNEAAGSFQVPLLPFFAGTSIQANMYLISQVSWFGLELVLGLILATIVSYFLYGYSNSRIGNSKPESYINASNDENKVQEIEMTQLVG